MAALTFQRVEPRTQRWHPLKTKIKYIILRAIASTHRVELWLFVAGVVKRKKRVSNGLAFPYDVTSVKKNLNFQTGNDAPSYNVTTRQKTTLTNGKWHFLPHDFTSGENTKFPNHQWRFHLNHFRWKTEAFEPTIRSASGANCSWRSRHFRTHLLSQVYPLITFAVEVCIPLTLLRGYLTSRQRYTGKWISLSKCR